MDATITRLVDTDSELCNILWAYGPGQGLMRLFTIVRDQASIDAHGEYPRTVTFNAAVDLTDLTSRAQAYLNTARTPHQQLAVEVPVVGADPQFRVGDRVPVASERDNLYLEAPIRGVERRSGVDGDHYILSFGERLPSLLDQVLRVGDEEERRSRELGLPPPVVRVLPARPGLAGTIQVMPDSRAMYHAVHADTTAMFTPDQGTLRIARLTDSRFALPELRPGVRWFVRAISYDQFGNASNPSEPVSAIADSLRPDRGTVSITELASGIVPPRIVQGNVLPVLPHADFPAGTTIYLVGEARLFITDTGATWRPMVDRIGAVNTAHIADLAITTPKITVGAVTTDRIATSAVTAAQIAAGAVAVAAFASDLSPVQLFNAATLPILPSASFPRGTIIYNHHATNHGLWQNKTGSAWTRLVEGGTDIVAGTVSTAQIAANAVTADRIAANAVTAGAIAANAVTAGRIAADAVTAGTIAAAAISTRELAVGAVTADRINVGLGGQNLLPNSGPAIDGGPHGSPLAEWAVTWNNNRTGILGPTLESGEWNPLGLGAIRVAWGPAIAADGITLGHIGSAPGGIYGRIPVIAGQRYEASAYLSAHRVSGAVAIDWLNATGGVVGTDSSLSQPLAVTTNQPLSAWPRRGIIATAPATAVYAGFLLTAVGVGSADPVLFASACYFGPATANQTALSEWTPAGVGLTAIDGGQIRTGTLHANRIVAGSITGDRIAANAVTAAQIAANAVTATQIAANAVIAEKIAANAVTAGAIAANAVTAGRIAADAVTAGTIAAAAISTRELAVGAVTADRINVGLGGQNLLPNSGPAIDGGPHGSPLAEWAVTWNNNRTGILGPTLESGGWNPLGLGAIRMGWGPDIAASGIALGDIGSAPGGIFGRIPVIAGQRYEASAYLSAHRCSVAVIIHWLDATGVRIGTDSSLSQPLSVATNQPLSAWPRRGIIATAPATAAYAGFVLAAVGNGSTNPIMFASACYFGPATPNQTALSGWTPAGIGLTAIDGGQIRTGTLHATRIVAGTITEREVTRLGNTTTVDGMGLRTRDGGGVERVRVGDVSGAPWGLTTLPAGTFGLWGDGAGLYLRGYTRELLLDRVSATTMFPGPYTGFHTVELTHTQRSSSFAARSVMAGEFARMMPNLQEVNLTQRRLSDGAFISRARVGVISYDIRTELLNAATGLWEWVGVRAGPYSFTQVGIRLELRLFIHDHVPSTDGIQMTTRLNYIIYAADQRGDLTWTTTAWAQNP